MCILTVANCQCKYCLIEALGTTGNSHLRNHSNGAELLCACLTAFFTPLIDIIESYRGDVIKFSGDALTIYFPAVEGV